MPFVVETADGRSRATCAKNARDGVVVVGRHASATLRTGEGDATTSRRHCEFRTVGRALECRDLGSTHGTRAREGGSAVSSEWTRVMSREDGAVEIAVGRGGTYVRARFEEDDASATEPDEGSATEPDDDAIAPVLVTDDGGEMMRSRKRRGVEVLGEAETVTIGFAPRVAVAETKASSPESKTNFKSFRKQFVVGLNANAKIKSPKKRGAPQAYAASVYEREETEDERRAREREEAKEKEAEALFGLGLGKAKDKKKAPARRR